MPEDFEDLYDLENLDDEDLHDLIVQELSEQPELDPELIEIEVEGGFVTLSGRVGTEEELQVAEHILTDVIGVSEYSNELVVDELVRAEYGAGADDAIAEDAETEASIGEQSERTEPAADHLLEDLEGELYGTHDVRRAIERGQAYEPPDRPLQEGSWSEENH